MSDSLRQLDHVVLAVHDLEHAIQDFRVLGFTVTPGGQHTGRSSHNALIVFEDGAYLELKAWRAPAPEEAWWRVLDAHGDGLVDVALWPDSVPDALAAARARGLDTLRGPLPGHRQRPDGAELGWETARHDTPDVPFLCADRTPRALRVPEGAARAHANGATGIARVQMAARDLTVTAARTAALLGPDVPLERRDHGHGMAALRYRLGHTDFEVFGPLPGIGSASSAINSEATNAMPSGLNTLARARLSTHGEGPFALHLRSADGAPSRPLDPARTHRALITLGA